MTVNKRVNLTIVILLSLLNLIALIVVFWSCTRGFDISDESYYYLGYLFYDNNPDLCPASFHMVYHRFFGWGNFTLIEVRFLRLLLTLGASVVLFLGAKSILRERSISEELVLFNVILSGMLLSYTWGPLALSYNTMSSILIASIVGFWSILFTRRGMYSKVLFSFIVGGLFTVLFFVKITNVLLLPLLMLLTLYLIRRKHILPLGKSKFVLLYSIAFIAGLFVFLTFISNADIQQTIVKYIQDSFGVLSNDSTHTTEYLLSRYYKNAKMVVVELRYPLVALTMLYFLLYLFWGRFQMEKHIKGETLFKAFGLIIIALLIFQNAYWKGGTKVVYTMVIIYVLMGAFGFLNRLLEKKPMDILLLLGLLSIPITGALGTNNGLSAQVLFYGVFLFLTLYYIVSSSTNPIYKYTILTILVGLGTSQVITATAIFPYRQTGLLKSQHQLNGVPALASLKLDANLSKLGEALAFLEKHEADYIYAYSAQRGMALFVNKKPYSLDWFNENTPEKICTAFNTSKINPDDVIFLIPSAAPLSKDVLQCMRSNGIFFLKEYSEIKRIKYYDHYYKKEILLNVYIPLAKKSE